MDEYFKNTVKTRDDEADKKIVSAQQALLSAGNPAQDGSDWPRAEAIAYAQAQALIALTAQLRAFVDVAAVQDQRAQDQLQLLHDVKNELLNIKAGVLEK